jgi:hypothetical protein
MSSLRTPEKQRLEQLFGMSSGYVLGFSDRTFGEFFDEVVGIDIHAPKYTSMGTSKANKLREFWRLESDPLVARVLLGLLDDRGLSSANAEVAALIGECKEIANRLLAGGSALGSLKEAAASLDRRQLLQQIQRLEQSVDADPDLAIGTAKELIETCCKTILTERGKPLEGAPSLPALTKAVCRELRLVPEGVHEAAKGAKTIRVILSNLGTIAQGLAELRQLYGTGHGREAMAKGLTARHARLAVGAATTLVTFLFDTHKDRR